VTWIGIDTHRLYFIQLKFSSSDEYLLNAIEYFTRRFSNAYFIVAIVMINLIVKIYFEINQIFSLHHNHLSVGDLITLPLCQHSTITGGTFR
jgi:hypothetical protein